MSFKHVPVRTIEGDLELAEGKRAGTTVHHIFGENTDVDTGTLPEDLWNGSGVYSGFPTGAAETVEAFSSDTNDDEGGTGAEKIRIYGLDANYEEVNEVITLNGTTGVPTTSTWTRVYLAIVEQSANGANTAFNVGTITIRHTTSTTNIFIVMSAATNRSRTGAFTIAAGHQGVLKRILFEVEGNTSITTEGSVWVRPFGKSPYLYNHFTAKDAVVYESNIFSGQWFPEKTDLVIRVTATSASNADVAGEMDIIQSAL